MDAKLVTARQEVEQREGGAAGAAKAHTDSRFLDLHTCMPGIIDSFDAAKQTAQVQPAIQRILRDEGAIDLPLCLDVPVVFPSGGNFVLTFPVTKGDECLLLFSERAIDFWYDRGGVQLPSEYRLHDLSDAFALVGVSSKPRFISSVAADATELRTRDGAMVVRLANGKVTLGKKASAQKTPKGADLIAQIKAITVPTAMGPSGTPINAAAFDATLSTDVENS